MGDAKQDIGNLMRDWILFAGNRIRDRSPGRYLHPEREERPGWGGRTAMRRFGKGVGAKRGGKLAENQRLRHLMSGRKKNQKKVLLLKVK